MKPVELEIFLQDGVTPGLKSAGKAVERFSTDFKSQLRDVTEALKIQRGIVSGLEKECGKLEKALKGAAPGAAWSEAQSKLTALRAELDAEKAGLVELTNQQRELKLAAENSGQSLRQQLRNVREEIATLLLAYRSLTDAEKQTAQGKELARHIDDLTEKAGELNDALVDTSQAVTNAASDTRSFDQLAGGMQLVVDGFGLATAGAQALGLSEADLIEVQTQLQTALVASNALTSMQTNLQKQSALMQGINTMQTKAAATAETIRTWAIGRGVIATKSATVAQAAFNAVAKANPYVLLATAVLSVVGAFFAFAKGSSAAKKAEAERQEQMRKVREQQERMAEEIGAAAGSQIASYMKLQKAWNSLGEDFDKKKRFVDENKKAFAELGFAVTNVASAETLLVEKTDDVIKAFVLRAKAAAYERTITDAYQQMITDQQKADNDARNAVIPTVRKGQSLSVEEYYRAGEKGARRETYTVYNGFPGGVQTASQRTDIEVTDPAAYRQGFIEETERLRQEARIRAEERADAIVADMNASLTSLKTELKTTYSNIGIPVVSTTTTTPSTITPDNRLVEECRIAEELQKIKWENDQNEINQMSEGAERRRRQIELDYEKERAEIEKHRRALAASNKDAGIPGLNENGLTDLQQSEIERALRINEDTRKAAISGLYDDLTDQYQSYTDKRLEIERKHNEDIEGLNRARRQAESDGDADAVARIDRSIAEAVKAKGKALVEHDFDVLRRSPGYVKAFEDLRDTSTETLQGLLEQLEKAKTAASSVLDPQDLREYTTTIREIMDELDSRDPIGNLARRAEELSSAQRDLAAAKRQLDIVSAGGKLFTGLRDEGPDATGKPVIVATYLSMEEALERYTKAKNRHAQAGNNFVKAEKDARETVLQLTEAIKGVGDAIGGTAGEIVGLIMEIGTFITDTIDGIKTVQKVGVEAVSAVEKASIILTIASTAVQLLQKINDLGNNRAFKEYEAYAEKVKEINALTDAVSQYRLALLEARQEEDSWFAEDGMRNLRNWRQYHDEVYAAYVKKASESQAIYRNQSGGGWLTGAFNWVMGNLSMLSWWNKWRDVWGQGGYDEGTTAAINNLRIETRKKSSGFLGTGIGGHSQKTEDLVSWARNKGLGELFDDKGLIDKELARSILDNYGDKLVGQTRETLEALIELREKYDEYLQNLHEYVSSLYEPLVDNFVDSLWDWLDNGKDALDSFKGYASDTFRDIVSDMLRTIILDKVVGSFSDDIAAVYEKYAEGKISEQELMDEVAKLTGGLIDRYGTNVPTLEGILDAVAGMFDKAGIDIRNPEEATSQSGRAGGFTAISQDQGTKLEGLFVSAQGHLSNIDTMVEDVVSKMNAAEGYLARIAENTESNAASAEEIKDLIIQIIRDGIKTL